MRTRGWDTVSVASVDAVNRALACDPRMVSATFSFALAAPPGYSGSGTFAPWRIVPGGTGRLLRVELPISRGTLTRGTGAAVDVSGLSAVVEVVLELLPSLTRPAGRDLRFTMTSVGDRPGGTTAGVVTPIRLNDPTRRLTFEQQAVLVAAIAGSLADNGAAVSWILATVGPVAGTESWLSPTASAFFYYESAHGGYLAVLSLTAGTDTSGLRAELDPAMVEGNPTVAFAFSPELFLRDVVMPRLPASFGHGTTTASFRFEPSDCSIVNTGRIQTNEVQSGLIWYQPCVDSLKITVDGSTVVTSVRGSCDMGLGITMTFTVQSRNGTSVDPTTGTMTFRPDPNPTAHHDASIPWYDYLLGPVPDAIMAIVVPIVADGIAEGLNASSSTVPVQAIPALSTRWTGLDGVHITAAGLDESFYLRGT